MIEIGFYNAWIAFSRVLTGRYPPRAINGLVKVLADDFHAFGKRNINFNYSPNLDPKTQAAVTQRMRERTAKVASRTTIFYHNRLKETGINLNKLDANNFKKIPVTTAAEFRGKEELFVNQKLQNHTIFFTSTGTTSYPPSGIWVTKYEMDLFAAGSAFSYLSQRQILPDDIVQISTVSRGALVNWLTMEACRSIGAAFYVSGLVDPRDGLLDLSKERKIPHKKEKASVLISHPSYVDLLARVGKELGYSAKDFRLERIMLGGEILSSAARQRIKNFFNSEIHEFYNCSELLPVSGIVCPEGNLHFRGEMQTEVLDPETFEEVSAGAEGLLCITPFYPSREGTLLLRYTPGDVVKKVDGCNCNFGGSVMSNICGKFDPALMKYKINRRNLVNALEIIPGVLLPLQFTLIADNKQRILHLGVSNKDDDVIDVAHSSLEKLGLKDVNVILHLPDERFPHYPNRSEMLEHTFHSLRFERAL